jgi:hypothetical protein
MKAYYTQSLGRNISTTIQPIHLKIGTHIDPIKGFQTSPESHKINHRKPSYCPPCKAPSASSDKHNMDQALDYPYK